MGETAALSANSKNNNKSEKIQSANYSVTI